MTAGDVCEGKSNIREGLREFPFPTNMACFSRMTAESLQSSFTSSHGCLLCKEHWFSQTLGKV